MLNSSFINKKVIALTIATITSFSGHNGTLVIQRRFDFYTMSMIVLLYSNFYLINAMFANLTSALDIGSLNATY